MTVTTSWNVQNAQRDLQARRPPPTVRPVTTDFIKQSLRVPVDPVPPTPTLVVQPAPSLGDLTTDHLSTELAVMLPEREKPLLIHERQIFAEATAAAHNWIRRRKEKPGLSFVLVAGELPPTCTIKDHAGRVVDAAAFDGYGCGKTTIARAMFPSCNQVAVPVDEWRPPTPATTQSRFETILDLAERTGYGKSRVSPQFREELLSHRSAEVDHGGADLVAAFEGSDGIAGNRRKYILRTLRNQKDARSRDIPRDESADDSWGVLIPFELREATP